MIILQLVLKQMRQRSLGTTLTLLSVMLAVGLATAIMLLRRQAENVFGQSDYGFEIVIGPKASKLQIVLNSVYHIDQSPGVIPYSLYERLAGRQFRRDVRWVLP